MQRRKKYIGARLRDKILRESKTRGCNLAALARGHKISAKTLYGWRRKYGREQVDSSIQANDKFVEVKLPEQARAGVEMKLQKAVLEFDEFRISMEGKLKSRYLSEILEILNQA